MNAKCVGSACCRFAALLSLLSCLAWLAGCGGSSAHGKVSGKVLYNDKPVTGGTVTFRPADTAENAVFAQIDANGNYSASVPVGPVKIAVNNKDLEPLEIKKSPRPTFPKGTTPATEKEDPRVNPQKPPGTYVKIPEKYNQVESSGLTYTVKSKSQNFDIKLE
jgi:hypothetical protein